jgi:choline dehydrogenase-like flavoprotein
MDNVGSHIWAQFPQLENLPPYNDEGVSLPHVWMPWWGLAEQRSGRLDFPRGYHLEMSGGRREPSHAAFSSYLEFAPGVYGTKLKQEVRRYYGTFVRFTATGEMLPNIRSYFDINPIVKDKWGIPVVRFHYDWSENELRQFRHSQRSTQELIEASGGKVVGKLPDMPVVPGSVIHEVGGARMGKSARDSVLDEWGRVWGVENLSVVDGAAFPSHPHKNPTLTIMALAWRAADHVRELARRGDL